MILEDDRVNLLDEPIKKRIPRGYLACERCGVYEHHPLIYCSNCGRRLKRFKDMTWREFLSRFAWSGSGPINTIYRILNPSLVPDKMKPELREVYNEAKRIADESKRLHWKIVE